MSLAGEHGRSWGSYIWCPGRDFPYLMSRGGLRMGVPCLMSGGGVGARACGGSPCDHYTRSIAPYCTGSPVDKLIDRRADTFENITFPQLRWREVNITSKLYLLNMMGICGGSRCNLSTLELRVLFLSTFTVPFWDLLRFQDAALLSDSIVKVSNLDI